jgi:hypothetical protein
VIAGTIQLETNARPDHGLPATSSAPGVVRRRIALLAVDDLVRSDAFAMSGRRRSADPARGRSTIQRAFSYRANHYRLRRAISGSRLAVYSAGCLLHVRVLSLLMHDPALTVSRDRGPAGLIFHQQPYRSLESWPPVGTAPSRWPPLHGDAVRKCRLYDTREMMAPRPDGAKTAESRGNDPRPLIGPMCASVCWA